MGTTFSTISLALLHAPLTSSFTILTIGVKLLIPVWYLWKGILCTRYSYIPLRPSDNEKCKILANELTKEVTNGHSDIKIHEHAGMLIGIIFDKSSKQVRLISPYGFVENDRAALKFFFRHELCHYLNNDPSLTYNSAAFVSLVTSFIPLGLPWRYNLATQLCLSAICGAVTYSLFYASQESRADKYAIPRSNVKELLDAYRYLYVMDTLNQKQYEKSSLTSKVYIWYLSLFSTPHPPIKDRMKVIETEILRRGHTLNGVCDSQHNIAHYWGNIKRKFTVAMV
jgi:hypothetical protein